MHRVSKKGTTYLSLALFATALFLAFSNAVFAEDQHKLFINKQDLERLKIKGSAGSYNHDENENTDLLSHYSDPYSFKGETQIKPGWFARCGGDFSLKNAGPGTADFQVVLDGTHVHHETLAGNASRDYLVKHHDPVKRVGVADNLSDVGVVLNYSEDAVLKMTCK